MIGNLLGKGFPFADHLRMLLGGGAEKPRRRGDPEKRWALQEWETDAWAISCAEDQGPDYEVRLAEERLKKLLGKNPPRH